MSESVAWRVTSRAILFTLAVLVGLWLLTQISAVLVRVVLAVILAAGMKPLVDRLTARELRRQGRWTPPRGMVVLVVYVVTILLVVVAGGLLVQVVVVEVTNLVDGVPVYGPRVVDWANGVIDLVPGSRDLLAGVDVAGQVSGLVSRLFSVFAQAISVFQYVLGLASGLLDVLMILLLRCTSPLMVLGSAAISWPSCRRIDTSRRRARPRASTSGSGAGSAASSSCASPSASWPGSA